MQPLPFLPYGRPSIDASDKTAVVEALSGEVITRGVPVQEFETQMAAYVGADYAVAFSSGSTALSAAYWAMEIGPQDQILVSPNTFIATTATASTLGAAVRFVDIDRAHGGMSFDQTIANLDYPSLEGRLVVVPVHFAGIALDMQALYRAARQANVYFIEDAAHALGSYYPDGRRVGCCAYSAMTIFSFHPVKAITTGEGGMVTTNDPDLYEKLLLARNSGIVRENGWKYSVPRCANNFHMNHMEAALGLSQLKRLETFIVKRRKLVRHYRAALEGRAHIRLFDSIYDERTAYHLMVAQIDFHALKTTRDAFMEELLQRGIGTQLHYIPLYRHGCYADAQPIVDYFPEMEQYYAQALSLPLFYDMTEADVDRVVRSVDQVIESLR